MTPRPKLTDILNGGGDDFRNIWKATTAAGDNTPMPRGEYTARLISGVLEKSRMKGTPGYKMTFEVIEGPHTGRRLFHDVWLTPAAAPLAKRDLAKLGIKELDQLERPVPPGIVCKVTVVVRKDEDGIDYNEVRRFEYLRLEAPPVNPFPPDGDEHSGERTNPDLPI